MARKIISFDFAMSSTDRDMYTNKLSEQRVYTNDHNSVELEFRITDVTENYLPSVGASAMLYIYMADGSFFVKYEQHVKLDGNRFYYVLNEEEVKRSGMTKVQLVIKIGNTENASPLFDFKIINGLVKYPIRQVEIQDWTDLTAEARAFVDNIQALTAEEFAELKMDEKLIGLEEYYAGRLTTAESRLNRTMTQTEFDSWVATLLDGGPSIFMDTLAQLQSTYPNGSAGVALVRETDPARIYAWDGSAWEDFGDYQGIEIKEKTVTSDKLTDQAVIPSKTNFVKTGKNLADPLYFKKGQVTNTSGELVTSPSGFSSFYKLPIEQNTTYTLNSAASQYVLYDNNGSFLVYNNGSAKTFTTTDKQFFISVNGTEKIQIEKGTQSTTFERFYFKLREEVASQRAQLSSDIYIDTDKNKLVIPTGTIVKDTYKQYQTTKPQTISLDSVTTTNKFLYFNPSNNNFVLTPIEGNQNEDLFFIGSGYFNENLLFENFIGNSKKHVRAYVLGKNLADPSLYQKGKVLSTNGTIVTSPSGNSSVINVPIEPNTAYALTNASHFGFFDKNGSFISYDGTDDNFFTSPESAYFFTVNIFPDNLDKFQIEEGTVATSVEPYQRTYVWEDKAPTVEVDQNTVLKISFDLDEVTSKVNRLDGLSQSNMDEVYPFNSVKLCNVSKTEWGATKITYSDEIGFTRDGTNGDVMSEIPKFYMKRERTGRIETISLSGQELDGYSIHPAFVENGKILDAVYIGVYDGHIKGSQLRSISGVYPTSNWNITDFRSNAKYNRRGFGVLDWRSVNMLQTLFMFYFADRNSQSALAPGLTQFPWQTGSECIARNTATSTNTIRINSNVDGYEHSHFVVGQSVQIVETEGLWQHSENYTHKITNITDAGGGMLDITFDGEPKNIVAGTSMIYSRSQLTGLTDSVNGHVGVSNVLGGGYGQEAVKFLHIENLWGNIWSLIDGVVVIDLVPYVGMNMDDYSSDVTEIKAKYVPLDTKVPLQEGNNQDAGTENAYYIKEMSYDKLNKNVMVPIGIGDGASPTTMYSDPFYSRATGDYIPAFGGGIDHERRAGLFSTRFWTKNGDGRAAILEGARNQFKNI